MNIFKKILIGLVVLALAYGAGYYFAPDKIKIKEKVVEKIVEVEKEINLKEKEVIEKYDPITGKLIERIVRDKEKNSKKTEEKKETKKEKEKETIKEKKLYAVKGGAVVNPRDITGKLIPRVGAEMRLPVFNSWVGAEADINIDRPLVGAYIRLEF